MSNKAGRGKQASKNDQAMPLKVCASKQTSGNASLELIHEALKELRVGIKEDVAAVRDEILSELRSSKRPSLCTLEKLQTSKPL